jgi:hypothetical protein
VQGEAALSTFIDSVYQQFGAQLTLLPLGTFRLYGRLKATVQRHQGSGTFNVEPAAGGQLYSWLWLEAGGVVFPFYNYLESEARYVNNSIDKSLWKQRVTVTLAPVSPVRLNVSLIQERKKDCILKTSYNQYSVSGGLTWVL